MTKFSVFIDHLTCQWGSLPTSSSQGQKKIIILNLLITACCFWYKYIWTPLVTVFILQTWTTCNSFNKYIILSGLLHINIPMKKNFKTREWNDNSETLYTSPFHYAYIYLLLLHFLWILCIRVPFDFTLSTITIHLILGRIYMVILHCDQ